MERITSDEMVRRIEELLVNANTRMAQDNVPDEVRVRVLRGLRSSAVAAVGLNVDSPGYMASAIRRAS